MGCCRKDKKKSTNKNGTLIKAKDSQLERKKNSTDDTDKRKRTTQTAHDVTGNLDSILDRNLIINNVDYLQKQPIRILDEKTAFSDISNADHGMKSSTILSSKLFSNDIRNDTSMFDNIFSVNTLYDLQQLVVNNEKPIAIVFFYADYCPYSKRMISSLRPWAQANKDRIVLYEADVEQALKLVECYRIGAIPTLIALNKNDLLTPIWRRTASDVLPSNLENSLNHIEEVSNNQNDRFKEIFRQKLDKSSNNFIIFDSTTSHTNRGLKAVETQNDTNQEQYLIVLEGRQSETNESKLILAIANDINETELLKIISESDSKYYGASKDISSVSNRSMQDLGNNNEPPSKPLCIEETNEYNGRMISKSSIDTSYTSNPSKRNDTWSESLENLHKTIDQSPGVENQQHILLPNSNEIFYEKRYKNPNGANDSSSFDRFSTLTYQHVKDTNDLINSQREEICVLYFGPNRCRGFEENLYKEATSSKLSLLTLKSNTLVE